MSKRSDWSLFGLILLIIGIYILIRQYCGFNFSALQYLIIGAAFFLLYHTKRKTWALVLSIPIMTFAIIDLIPFSFVGENFIATVVIFMMSIVFLVLYFTKYSTSFLITGCILFWLGICTLLLHFNILMNSNAAFPLCLGFAFLSIYLFARNTLGKWPMYLGTLFSIMGFLYFISIDPIKLIAGPVIISILFITGSFYFIKARLNK